MNKNIVFIVSILILFSCSNEKNKTVEDEKSGRPMLLGETDRSAFEQTDFLEWYNAEYTGYEPDEFVIEQIKDFSDSIEIEIFMGTWCSDSRREVPRFLKIVDQLGFNENKLQIINVDRKKRSPNRAEKNKDIEFVPTFIINKNGEELGRIVEFPIITLEGDLLNILLGIQ